jgi:DNA-binding response OmpR family regulator
MTNKSKSELLIELVEDEAALRDILAESLRKEGFQVITAENGKIGLELALSKHPDLVVSDIIMPEMSGLEMLKRLREDEIGKNIPVLMLSNLKSAETVSESLKNLAFDYILKTDTDPKSIIDKIKQKFKLD